jgi:hypothetical protein
MQISEGVDETLAASRRPVRRDDRLAGGGTQPTEDLLPIVPFHDQRKAFLTRVLMLPRRRWWYEVEEPSQHQRQRDNTGMGFFLGSVWRC